MHDLKTGLVSERLGLLVEHDETGLAAGSLPGDELKYLGIGEKVIAHVPHRPEIDTVAPPGHEHARMHALERVEVREVIEVPHPAVNSQQVERGRRDEIQRRGVGVEERAQVREAREARGTAARAARRRHRPLRR